MQDLIGGLRDERLGFRVDEPTKALIERAAQLERRKLTDFCMTALTEAARRTIAEHEIDCPLGRATARCSSIRLSIRPRRMSVSSARLRNISAGSRGECQAAVRIFVLRCLARCDDRAGFTCGVESLDRYLKTQAGQDVRRKANAVFVSERRRTRRSAFSAITRYARQRSPTARRPEEARKHIPRYPLISCTLIGRLADREG